jgi:hypothetical protein
MTDPIQRLRDAIDVASAAEEAGYARGLAQGLRLGIVLGRMEQTQRDADAIAELRRSKRHGTVP